MKRFKRKGVAQSIMENAGAIRERCEAGEPDAVIRDVVEDCVAPWPEPCTCGGVRELTRFPCGAEVLVCVGCGGGEASGKCGNELCQVGCAGALGLAEGATAGLKFLTLRMLKAGVTGE